MKKLIKVAGLSLVVLSSSLVANAAEAAQKVAYVNTAQIFQQLPQVKEVGKKLEKEFKDREAEIKSLGDELKSKSEKLRRDRELLSDKEISELQIELASLDAEYKLKGQALERDGKRQEMKEKQKLFKLIQEAVTKVAEKEGVDMVVDAQALQYAKPELDLSQKVIEELK